MIWKGVFLSLYVYKYYYIHTAHIHTYKRTQFFFFAINFVGLIAVFVVVFIAEHFSTQNYINTTPRPKKSEKERKNIVSIKIFLSSLVWDWKLCHFSTFNKQHSEKSKIEANDTQQAPTLCKNIVYTWNGFYVW